MSPGHAGHHWRTTQILFFGKASNNVFFMDTPITLGFWAKFKDFFTFKDQRTPVAIASEITQYTTF